MEVANHIGDFHFFQKKEYRSRNWKITLVCRIFKKIKKVEVVIEINDFFIYFF